MPTQCALTIMTLYKRLSKKKAFKPLVTVPCQYTFNRPTSSLYMRPLALPKSEKAAVEVLSLPLYPEMTDDQLQRVTQALTSLATAR
jgi:dTDP-4-amino-4,6-dideoxygalactose transaminase